MDIARIITRNDRKDEVEVDREVGVEKGEIRTVIKGEIRKEKKNQDIMNEVIELIMIDMIKKGKGNWIFN